MSEMDHEDKQRFVLREDEKVIAVVPEYCSGPGWSNEVTMVYIVHFPSGKLRTECIQPDERPSDLTILFEPGAAMSIALQKSVRTLTEK